MSKKQLDYSALDALLQYKTTKSSCAEYLGVSEDTIDRRLKEDKGMTFSEYHKLKSGRLAVKLQQKAVDMAFKGNSTLMIFCLKNLAGWADKVDTTNQDVTAKDVNALKEEAAELMKELE